MLSSACAHGPAGQDGEIGGMSLMDEFKLMLGLLILGFIALAVGFSFRDKGWGVWLMLIGSACLVITVATSILRAVALT